MSKYVVMGACLLFISSMPALGQTGGSGGKGGEVKCVIQGVVYGNVYCYGGPGGSGGAAFNGGRTDAPPSFDCSANLKPDERAVCQNPGLARLDWRLDTAYRQAKSRVPTKASDLQQDQRAWLRQRAACSNSVACLRSVYDTRIAELQNWR